MYKIYNEEQEDLSYKSWVTITREDAWTFKSFTNLENLKYVVEIVKKLLENDKSSDLIVIEDEDLMSFVVSQDWLYNYDVFKDLNLYELDLVKSKLEDLLKKEKEKFNELMHATLPSDEYTEILNYIMRTITKYKYQLYSVNKLICDKFGSNNLDGNGKAK